MSETLQRVEERLEIDEVIVRLFVMVGTALWAVAALASYLYGRTDAFIGYGSLALFSGGILVLGLFYERISAMLLVIAAGAFIAWGVVAAWETGMWVIVALSVIAPMILAAVMYSMAGYEEEVIERAHNAPPIHVVHA